MRSGYFILDLPIMLVQLTLSITMELVCSLLSLLSLSLPFLKQQKLNGKTVLLTGAGSGIGRETSLELCRQGCTLVLWDVNSAGNEETCRLIREIGGRAYPYTVDLSDRDALEKGADTALREHGRVDIVVCNAGILNLNRLCELQHDEIEQLFIINFLSMVLLTKFFLQKMIEQDEGHIVCIASLNALRASTHSADYSASKAAVSSYCISLMQELDRISCSHVHVSVVYPGYVNTPLISGLSKYFKYLNPIDVGRVAREIVAGVRAYKQFIYVPNSTIRLVSFMNFLCPVTFSNLVYSIVFGGKFDPVKGDERVNNN